MGLSFSPHAYTIFFRNFGLLFCLSILLFPLFSRLSFIVLILPLVLPCFCVFTIWNVSFLVPSVRDNYFPCFFLLFFCLALLACRASVKMDVLFSPSPAPIPPTPPIHGHWVKGTKNCLHCVLSASYYCFSPFLCHCWGLCCVRERLVIFWQNQILA